MTPIPPVGVHIPSTHCLDFISKGLKIYFKAYIPNFHVGALRWSKPPTPEFRVGGSCWYLKTRKFTLPSTPNLKFALAPMPNPNISQWNTGCVGSQKQISRVGHVHFMFSCVDFICVGYPTQTRFQWNMDF